MTELSWKYLFNILMAYLIRLRNIIFIKLEIFIIN